MSPIKLNRFVALAGSDPACREALQNHDVGVLAAHGLTADQIAALGASDTAKLLELGLRPGLCMTVTVLRNPAVVMAGGDAAEYFR